MIKVDSIVYAQLPSVRQIIRDETWLEAERRGCAVNADDSVVRENVCGVVLRIGARLRESTERMIAASPQTMADDRHNPEVNRLDPEDDALR